jgi:hypothetical protein
MAKIAKLNLTQKQKALHHQARQDFTQHELENMNLSNQKISFQMQGMFNQCLYQMQIVANLVIILLGEGQNPNINARKNFLDSRSKTTIKPNTTYP